MTNQDADLSDRHSSHAMLMSRLGELNGSGLMGLTEDEQILVKCATNLSVNTLMGVQNV